MIAPLALAFLLGKVSAQTRPGQAAFIGCVMTATIDEPLVASMDTTGSACGEFCLSTNTGPGNNYFPYAYFAINNFSFKCFCSNSGAPLANFPTTGGGLPGACPAGTAEAYVSKSTFSFTGCNTIVSSTGAVTSTTEQTQESCFQQCLLKNKASYTPNGGASNCVCYDDYVLNAATTCDTTTPFNYDHQAIGAMVGDASVNPSLYVKRQQVERRRRELEAKRNLCPNSMTACRVHAHGDAFECIDTTSELESCGGCLHGEVGKPNSAHGTDCNLVDGAAFGAVTCQSGTCMALACEMGFNLSNGKCVA